MRKGKLEKIQSVQMYSPILDVLDGVIITRDGRFLKMMEFTPINFGLRSVEEQNQIIESYKAVLRNMPSRVQFIVSSRKANVENYLTKLRREYETENNRGCADLIASLMKKVQADCENGSYSRRFFIIFEYAAIAGVNLNKPSFETVREALDRQARQIRNTILACGNEQISVDSEESSASNYVMSTLYSLMSRGESEKYSYGERVNDVMARYLNNESYSDIEEANISVNEFICPKYIDTRRSPKYLVIDGIYYMFCYIPGASYPAKALGGWMQSFTNLLDGVDVTFYFEKEALEKTRMRLQLKLRFNKVKYNDTDDTSNDFEELGNAIRAGYYLKKGISSGDEFCYMATLLTISASTKQEMLEKYDEVKQACIRWDVRVKQAKYLQEECYGMSLPVCKKDPAIFMKGRRNILCSDLASSYPFVSFEMNDEDGIMLGTNLNNGSPVIVDLWERRKYNNSNSIIIGSSGAGKSYLLSLLAMRERERKLDVYIIAPLKGFEFKRSCEAIGGQYIKISPGSAQNINIMEIRKANDETNRLIDGDSFGEESILQKKTQQLLTFFSIMMGENEKLNYEEVQILDDAITKTYGKFGITSDNRSLDDPVHPGCYRPMPVLGDLYEILKEFGRGADRLIQTMTRFVSGSASSFNRQTNVQLTNKYIVIDVSDIPDRMLSLGMMIALDYIWDRIKSAPRTEKKSIYIDECWKLLGSTPEAASFVTNVFKTCRSYNTRATAATQDVGDFFKLENGKYGKTIINNSKIKFVMKSEPREADTIAEELELSPTECDEVKRLQRGICLLVANSNHVFIKVKATGREHDLITTDAADLKRIAEQNRLRDAIRNGRQVAMRMGE